MYSTETGNLVVRPWNSQDVPLIFDSLEVPSWAPWLKAEQETLLLRHQIFPAGQLLVEQDGKPLASLSLTRINWDGMSPLGTWDACALDYARGYQPTGNALLLLSMNVALSARNLRLPSLLVSEVKAWAHREPSIEHVIGPFRPSSYPEYKAQHPDANFHTYCLQKNEADRPIDAWLRSLSHHGLTLLNEAAKSMEVTVPYEEFDRYRTEYQPNMWRQLPSGVWECGEVGSWTLDLTSGTATYTESNIWGKLSL